MSFSAHVLGLPEIEKAFTRVMADAAAASVAIVTESAALVEARAKGNFEGAHAKGQPHVGGDKPNIVTGTLRRSIRHEPVRREGVATAATKVGPSVIYARRVELGYNGSKGYPYFTPAVDEVRDQLVEIAHKHWAKVARGGH